jgi:hypothetical protein
MDEISLVKHLLKLYDVANKRGLLQLEDYRKNYDNNSNEQLNNDMYVFCLNAVIDNHPWFLKTIEYLKINRSCEEHIIIKGFEMIFEHTKSINDAANILGLMLEHSKFEYELLGEEYFNNNN